MHMRFIVLNLSPFLVFASPVSASEHTFDAEIVSVIASCREAGVDWASIDYASSDVPPECGWVPIVLPQIIGQLIAKDCVAVLDQAHISRLETSIATLNVIFEGSSVWAGELNAAREKADISVATTEACMSATDAIEAIAAAF